MHIRLSAVGETFRSAAGGGEAAAPRRGFELPDDVRKKRRAFHPQEKLRKSKITQLRRRLTGEAQINMAFRAKWRENDAEVL